MNQVATITLPGTRPDLRYPDSDGRFMGDTDYHNLAMIWLREALEDYFADDDVYVASNLVFYWQEGAPKKRRDPDVLVAKGVGKHRRRSYRLWEERKLPCTLFEIASKRTWKVDVNVKPELYAGIGIKEYFVFDPEGAYLHPTLLGFRGVKGQPKPMRAAKDGSLVSKQLGLRLVAEGEMLRLVDLATGKPILTRSEFAEEKERQSRRERRLRKQQERLHRLEKEQLEAEVQRLRRALKN